MNERIRELAKSVQCERHWTEEDIEKFALLIVGECIDQGKKVQSQTVSNGSEDYNDGRKMGIEVIMNHIKEHFGVLE